MRALPTDHPLYGEFIPDGPFPAGVLPGDIRINLDGSSDFYQNDKWAQYSDSDGNHTISDPNIDVITRG
jgi:hypothetical protein